MFVYSREKKVKYGKEMISQWEENKHKLEEYFRTTTQDNYSEYKDIVKKIFELCLLKSDNDHGFNIE